VTEQLAVVGVSDVTLEAVVMRAVSCAAHDAYDADCPDCLTGEEAQMRGIKQPAERKVLGFWKRRSDG
jgi:hypothetical protein